jgi:hypothetical protein
MKTVLEINRAPLTDWYSECEVTRLCINGSPCAGIRFHNLSRESRNKIARIAR